MKEKIHINDKVFESEIKTNNNRIEVLINGKNHKIDISQNRVSGFRSIIVDGEAFEVFCERKGEKHFLLWLGHNCYDVKFGETSGGEQADDGVSVISAPMPGMVAKLKVKENDKVSKGDPILILEAMKMQNELKSPRDGIIKEILVTEGTKVALQDKLILLK